MRVNMNILLTAVLISACDSSSSSTETPLAPIPVSGGTGEAVSGGTSVTGEKPTAEGENPSPSTPTGSGLSEVLPLGLRTQNTQYLNQLGDALALKAQAFDRSIKDLRGSATHYCEARSPENLRTLQNQWKVAMGEWQTFEVFQIGPVAENAKTLKYNIYAWPDPANLCKIDEEALKASRNANYRLPPNNNRKGLQALEYLIFESTLGSRCAAGTAVANDWNGLSEEAKIGARCAYIQPLAEDLTLHSAELATRWGVPGSSYLTQLIGDPVREQQVLQNLYEGFFYVDLEVKNQKLAAPAGLDVKHCATSPVPCPERAEFQFADFSRQAVDINFRAMIDLFFGPKTESRSGGFSALVRDQGGDAVATRTEAALVELSEVLEMDKDRSLADLVMLKGSEHCDVSNVSWLCRTRSIIQKLAGDLKDEYAQILKVKAPEAAAGDND